MEADRPSRSRRAVTCDDAGRLIAAFVAGDLPGAGRSLLGAHVAACEACRRTYRGALEAAGRLGSAVRAERGLERRRRVLSLRQRSRSEAVEAAGERGGKRRARGALLRLALLPAGIVFLLTAIPHLRKTSPALEVQGRGGPVRVGDTELSAAAPRADLLAGEWLVVGAGASAELVGGGARIAVSERTELLVEHSGVPRFVLRRGELALDGACRVSTPRGMVVVESGAVRLRSRDGVLRLESEGGSAELVDASGRRRVAAGSPALVVE